MIVLAYHDFLKTLPTHVAPLLPPTLPPLTVRQPYRWLVQWYDQDPAVHYEVLRVRQSTAFEIGLHFESPRAQLNEHLLTGFLHRLIEVHALLGPDVVAEPWDRGWCKVYRVLPAEEQLTDQFQQTLAAATAALISALHPLLNDCYAEPVRRMLPQRVPHAEAR